MTPRTSRREPASEPSSICYNNYNCSLLNAQKNNSYKTLPANFLSKICVISNDRRSKSSLGDARKLLNSNL